MGSEVCPTEDAILALLEFLVEPVLTGGKTPSPAQEAYVAKQVQAVVLLYNCYHRKQNPELGFLDFISFCKLAVIFRPSLLRYMKFMQGDDHSESVDLRKELSLVEKVVMEACDVSKSLDTPKDIVPGTHISKVAVFLVDHMKENCFLLQSTNTMGAWSVIERENSLAVEHEGTSEEKAGTKKKRITKKPLKGSRSLDESGLQQLAFAAVKDACGWSQSDLKVMESHIVYSFSKERTASRFYIMQCIEANNESNCIPIRDITNSLQGPLMKREASRWVTTSVVQHFHVLPYADIISNWFSRKETLVNSHEQGLMEQNHEEPPTGAVHEDEGNKQLHNISVLHALEAPFKMLHAEERHTRTADPKDTSVLEQIGAGKQICPNVTFITEHDSQVPGSGKQNTEAMLNNLQSGYTVTCKAEDPVQTVVYKRRNKSLNQSSLGEYTRWKQAEAVEEHCKTEDRECAGSCLPSDMEVDGLSAITCSVDVECRTSSSSGEVHVADGMKRLPSQTTVVVKESAVCGLQNDAEKSGENVSSKYKAVPLNQYKVHDQALVPFGSNPKGFDKVHDVLSSKGILLSQAALKVIRRKRDMLCHQLRIIQDEIALCDKNIQTLLSGGEDGFAVALDTVIEGCNDASLCGDVPTHDTTHQQVQDQGSFEYIKNKRICIGNLSTRKPRQEL